MNILNIYNITADLNFFKNFIEGIIEKKEIYYNINNVIILLPTKLACDSLKAEFNEKQIHPPKIFSISDLSLLTQNNGDSYERMTLVNKAIRIIISEEFIPTNNLIAVTELAEYFVDLLIQCDTYQIDLDIFSEALNVNTTLHTQSLNQVLQRLIKIWQQDCLTTKAKFNNKLIDELSNSNNKLIIAGINSSIPSIINLIASRFGKAGSYIVFYGLDQSLSKTDWQNIEENHCQQSFKTLLNSLSVEADQVLPWNKVNKIKNISFISEALKPSASCNNWNELNLQSDSIRFIETENQHEEAKEIISLIKNNVQDSIMVVTADEALMVELILRINIEHLDVNIVRDNPLNNSKAALWLKLSLNFILEKYSSLSALSLLKHPYMNIDDQEIEDIELALRDRNFFKNNLFDINIESQVLKDLQEQVNHLKLFESFDILLEQHLTFSSKICKVDLWNEAPELKEFIDKISCVYDVFSNISLKDYAQLFNHSLNSAYYRTSAQHKKRVSLLKPIDARLHNAELVILAGLNDGIWPKHREHDLILNKNLLPSDKQRMGEEAYDFYCLASANKVFLTRAKRKEGNFLTATSWFLRALTLSKRKIVSGWVEKPEKIEHNALKNQQFIKPPISYRPKKLSVTQIEKLIFNPYHIYVDFILKLKPLSQLKKEISSLDFGNFVHKALEIYHLKKIPLLEAGEQALKIMQFYNPQIKLLWWPRFIRIAKWFITLEDEFEKIYLEHVGQIRVTQDFVVLAKADRVEIYKNKIKIKDYKTGSLPSIKSIKNGKSLQLLLEGVIALKNGFSFQEKEKQYSLSTLEYIQVSGGEEPGQVLTIDYDEDLLEKAGKFLENLIKEYSLESTPYYYTQKKTINYCFYEHLARKFDK